MRKEEYLQNLEKFLWNIPAEDREEAIQFYRDYLEDAGEEWEEVLAALGSPEELAQSIYSDLYGENPQGDFRRKTDTLPGTYRVPAFGNGKFSGNEKEPTDSQEASSKETTRAGKLSLGQWIILAIICLCALPILVPLGGGLLAVIIAIVFAVIGIVFGIGIAAVALVVAAIVIIVAALIKVLITPVSALIMLGGGLLSAGFGLVGIALTLWVVFKVIPAIFKWIGKLF